MKKHSSAIRKVIVAWISGLESCSASRCGFYLSWVFGEGCEHFRIDLRSGIFEHRNINLFVESICPGGNCTYTITQTTMVASGAALCARRHLIRSVPIPRASVSLFSSPLASLPLLVGRADPRPLGCLGTPGVARHRHRTKV